MILDIWPPYASYLAFEFATSKVDGNRYVRAVYNDAELKMLDSSQTWLPYESFVSRLKNLSISDEEYAASATYAENSESLQSDPNIQATMKLYQKEIQETTSTGSAPPTRVEQQVK